MIRLFALMLGLFPAVLAAQVLPQPSAENPRIQSIRWTPNQEVVLTTLPQMGLTVMLEPGEQVNRVSVENQGLLDIRVSPELDSFLILPLVDQLASAFLVQTDRRDYRFRVRSDTGLTAAYLVKFEFDAAPPASSVTIAEPTGEKWRYRLPTTLSWPTAIASGLRRGVPCHAEAPVIKARGVCQRRDGWPKTGGRAGWPMAPTRNSSARTSTWSATQTTS